MPALICGSLAFDTITTFPGRFAQQILPEQLHILNVSFLVPTLKREFGGCAGNIAYTLRALGGEPVVLAALGNDGAGYLERLRTLGIDTSSVLMADDTYTAQAIIITDTDNNQITAFHPGAMMQAHLTPVPRRTDLGVAIVAPDGRDAMLQHAQQLSAADIPFVFDPGQGLPMFDGDDLRRFVGMARWVAVNDYEGRMLVERTGWSLEDMSRTVPGRKASAGMSRACRPRPSSTRPVAAMPSAPACFTAWSAAGRSSAAPNSAIGSVR
jgi:adenosine kinase